MENPLAVQNRETQPEPRRRITIAWKPFFIVPVPYMNYYYPSPYLYPMY